MTKYKSILIMVPSHIMFRYYSNDWSIFYIDVNKYEYSKNPKKWMD